MILRFFRELREPMLKCERLGHKFRDQVETGLVSPADYRRGVADSIKRRRCFCTRCGFKKPDDWYVVERKPIQNLSMPAEHFAELDNTGILVLRRWTEPCAVIKPHNETGDAG